MRTSILLPLFSVAASFFNVIDARAVFAHYLVGTITDAHALQDINDAIAMGLDAFALNVADPSASYVAPALTSLFSHAKDRGFKLFLSMDLSAKGGGSLSDYDYIFTDYATAGAWFAGPNGKPLVSTFSAAAFTAPDFTTWRASQDIYFMPDFDGTSGYYDAADSWWSYWGSVVDGLFSWESTWPNVGATNDGDLTLDTTVQAGAVAHGKTYMIGLSLLQYKDAYSTNLYRRGELNIAKRMENILKMTTAPLYVEIQTWNDGPEGHYIGNLWTEANGDAQPATYATQRGASHTGIQPLLTQFISAFKNSETSFPASTNPVGAIWYKTILQSTTCPDNSLGGFYSAPSGASVGTDTINWAVVLPTNGATYSIQFVSNGAVAATVAGKAGFQYGSVALSANQQFMKVVDSAGTVQYSTGLGRCVSATCWDDIYNYNPQILALEQGDHASVGCWQMTQQASAANGATNGPFYPSGI
ncbi:Mutanase [Lachnellula hyalina]|uniref:Mutanase n=1 Tax=Lachnellula hyalina TaxID=1316788 RepID=A0A8H8QZJ5_9HELO|nr:Mutanase [Lachnellula hyalina]TVY25040.1 Mutanase [Lachnellula hyalina]